MKCLFHKTTNCKPNVCEMYSDVSFLRPDSSNEGRSLKLLPGRLPPSCFGIIGISLLSNASPELVPVLSVQSLIPGVIISSSCTELAALLICALCPASSLGSGGPHRVTVLGTGGGNAVVWNGGFTKGCRLGDGHGLVGVGVGGLGVDGVKSCDKQDHKRHRDHSLHLCILLVIFSLENSKTKSAAVGLLLVNSSKLSNL